jgi:hypothetical protein
MAEGEDMNWKTVASSNLKRIAYDPDTKQLHVEFMSGQRYAYTDVPKREYNRLRVADGIKDQSVGKVFNNNVRGRYKYETVKEPSKDNEGSKDNSGRSSTPNRKATGNSETNDKRTEK